MMKTITTAMLMCSMQFCPGQYFSGKIDYQTTIEVKDTNSYYLAYQRGKYGSSLVIEVDQKGRIKRSHFGTKNPGFEYMVIDPVDSNSYSKFTFSDSLFVSDPRLEVTSLLSIDTLTPEEILGRECRVYRLTLIENSDQGTQIWYLTIWLDPKLKVKPELYSYWNEGHWNTISSLEEAMYLKLALTNNFLKVTYSALSLEEKKIKYLDPNPDNLSLKWIDP